MTDRKNRAITFLQLAARGETDQAFRAVSPNFRHHRLAQRERRVLIAVA